MKKVKRNIIILFIIIAILLIPIPIGPIKDGGTMFYKSFTYIIVKWKVYTTAEPNNEDSIYRYQKTSIFFFPDNFKTLDELWEIECNNRNLKDR